MPSLVVCLLGLVGTPPTAVFVGKLAVFTASADGGFIWLVVLAAANTVASLFYYLRWFGPAFRAAYEQSRRPVEDAAAVARLPVLVLHSAAVGAIALGLAAGAVAGLR